MEFNIAILISGGGSNMVNIVKASQKEEIKSKVLIVIADGPQAEGIKKAKDLGVDSKIINYNKLSKKEFEQKLLGYLKKKKINLICLAGFMKILSKEFIKNWERKIINIHPSLLPSFKGLNTHEKAIKMKVKYSGCTVHFVNEKLDSGEIIDQDIVKINDKDNEHSLRKKILMKEHKLYIRVIRKMEKINGKF